MLNGQNFPNLYRHNISQYIDDDICQSVQSLLVNLTTYYYTWVKIRFFPWTVHWSTIRMKTDLLGARINKEFPSHIQHLCLSVFPLIITFAVFVCRLRNFVTHTAISFGMCPTTSMLADTLLR